MLILHVTYTLKTGNSHEFIAELEQGPAPAVRTEDGNICYDYFIPVGDDRHVLLIEKWHDEAALSAHMQTPNMELIRSIKNKYVDNTLLEKYSVQSAD